MTAPAEALSAESSRSGSARGRRVRQVAQTILPLLPLVSGFNSQVPALKVGEGMVLLSVGCVPGAEPGLVYDADAQEAYRPVLALACYGSAGRIVLRFGACPSEGLDGLRWSEVGVASERFLLDGTGEPVEPAPLASTASTVVWKFESLSSLAVGIKAC